MSTRVKKISLIAGAVLISAPLAFIHYSFYVLHGQFIRSPIITDVLAFFISLILIYDAFDDIEKKKNNFFLSLVKITAGFSIIAIHTIAIYFGYFR